MTKFRHIIVGILYKLFVKEQLKTTQIEKRGQVVTRSCIELKISIPFAIEWFKKQLMLTGIVSVFKGKNGNERVITEVDRFNSTCSETTITLQLKQLVTSVTEKLMLGSWQQAHLQLTEQTIYASAQQKAT